MQYKPLFSLQIRHDYYTNGECSDFRIIPSEGGEEVLSNHRMLFQKKTTGFQVFAPVVDDPSNPGQKTLFLPLSDGTVFQFLLYLQNPAFSGVTDFSVPNSVFSNIDGLNVNPVNELLVTSKEANRTDTFYFHSPVAEEGGKLQFLLTQNPMEGTTLGDCVFSGDGTEVELLPENVLQLNPNGQTAGKCSLSYPVPGKIPNGTFGLVEIHVPDASVFTDFSNPDLDNNFELSFTSNASYWKYWIVPEISVTADELSITEGDSVAGTDMNGDALNGQQYDLGDISVNFFLDSFDVGTDKANLNGSALKDQIAGITGPNGEIMEESAIDRFVNDIQAFERQNTLSNGIRFLILSDQKIPNRAVYNALPQLKIEIVTSSYIASFRLSAPKNGTDQAQLIRLRDAFSEPADLLVP